MNNCIFCKFASHEIPKDFVYEDEEIMVFPDIRPIKPIHLLVMPKKHIVDFSAFSDDGLLSKLRQVIQKLAKKKKLGNAGYRIVINAGGAQAINHLHFHFMGPMGKAAGL